MKNNYLYKKERSPILSDRYDGIMDLERVNRDVISGEFPVDYIIHRKPVFLIGAIRYWDRFKKCQYVEYVQRITDPDSVSILTRISFDLVFQISHSYLKIVSGFGLGIPSPKNKTI